MHQKKPSKLTCPESLQICGDEALGYLINICGYNNNLVGDIVHNNKMMEELFLLLNEVKARAMSAFRLTLSEINIPEPNFEDIENSANPIVANKKEFEQFLSDNLSTKKFQKATTMLEKVTDGDIKMQSKYHLYKPAKELVTDYKINNTEFKPTTFTPEVAAAGSTINAANTATRQSTTATAASFSSTSSLHQMVSLTQNLMRDKENNNRIVLKSDSKTPEFLFGAYLPLDNVMKLILMRIGKIVEQIPGATIHDALGTSMIIGCADAAEMDSLPKVSKHVTSFSMVPTSFFWLKSVDFSLHQSKISYHTIN